MKSSKTSSVHVFQMPLPVWTATHFSTMIDWASEQICEPPFLRNHTIEDIKAFEITPLTLDVPSNTQHVLALQLLLCAKDYVMQLFAVALNVQNWSLKNIFLIDHCTTYISSYDITCYTFFMS